VRGRCCAGAFRVLLPCGVVLCTVTVITLVASFPLLADRLDVLRVAWPRPRQAVIDLIGRDMVSDTVSHRIGRRAAARDYLMSDTD
jgi:hypothetical protein